MADTSALTHYSPEVLALWGEADEAASEKWRQEKINDFEVTPGCAGPRRPVRRQSGLSNGIRLKHRLGRAHAQPPPAPG